MLKNILPVLILASLLFSCNKKESSTINKFADPVVVRICDLKDHRLSDSLYKFFVHENVVYRNEAVLAFASIQDSAAVEKLGKLLVREADTTVRKSIAFSIGQIRSRDSEIVLLGALMREKSPSVIRELLESYGKVTSHWQLIQPALLNDTLKAEGLAWSIYRAGLNGKTDSAATRIAISLLDQKHHEQTQLGAAHFLARSGTNFEEAFDLLADLAQHNRSADLRMAATSALRKINTPQSLAVLKDIIDKEKDPRVKTNAVRALQNFDFEETKSTLYNCLYDKSANVGIAASELIKSQATNANWIELSNLTGRIQNWRIQANLYEASLSKTDNKGLVEEVVSVYRQSNNPYQRAALITALHASTASFDFISEEMIKADTAVIRSAAATALVDMHQSKNFNLKLKEKFAALCSVEMPKGDLAVIGSFAGVLADPAMNYKTIIKDFNFLNDARKKLSLPRDNEALQPLESALAYFENRKAEPVKNEFNNPIDWSLVKTIGKDQEVVIKTTRGKIKLRLFVEEAPGSVANFIRLAKENYFNQKFFHRVVPNFVIQAGCYRGDGWGGEDFSLRSEFSTHRYKTGSVGMASAGKDTEGTQWFITHSPTPHLDGRYTLFAEVIEGMEVVNYIEVGDQILDVQILK
jgi:cyclophilin family peptidyl-prolyl cis-trans isomerase/HEAT repeat protein